MVFVRSRVRVPPGLRHRGAQEPIGGGTGGYTRGENQSEEGQEDTWAAPHGSYGSHARIVTPLVIALRGDSKGGLPIQVVTIRACDPYEDTSRDSTGERRGSTRGAFGDEPSPRRGPGESPGESPPARAEGGGAATGA
eukprot:1737573-Pyramimonas_sp.AAC.1